MDDTIRRYIAEVTALQERRADALSAEDLAAVARGVGLTVADVAAIDAEVDAHMVRARGFASNSMWEDAAAEMETISALAPGRVDALDLRARIHTARWREQGRAADRQHALALWREVVEREPERVHAYALIKELQIASQLGTRRALALAGAGLAGVGVWFAGAPVLAAVGAASLVAAVGAFATRSRRTGATDLLAVAGLLSAGGSLRDHPSVDPSKLEIPIILDDPAAWSSLDIKVRARFADSYPDSTYCRVSLELRPVDDKQVDGLTVRVDVEDGGEVIRSQLVEFLDGGNIAPALQDRPAVVELLISHDAAIHPTAFRLVLLGISTGTAPTLAAGEPLTVDWKAPRPERFNLAFRYLGETLGIPDTYRYLWWEVENLGGRPVRKLHTTATVKNESGDLIGTVDNMVTYTDRTIFPGETRLSRFSMKVSGASRTLELAVTELD